MPNGACRPGLGSRSEACGNFAQSNNLVNVPPALFARCLPVLYIEVEACFDLAWNKAWKQKILARPIRCHHALRQYLMELYVTATPLFLKDYAKHTRLANAWFLIV